MQYVKFILYKTKNTLRSIIRGIFGLFFVGCYCISFGLSHHIPIRGLQLHILSA